MVPKKCQVGVIGAGLSGIICALECQRRGLETVILESSQKVGGRLQSEIIQGAICDRGFQVFLPSYPTAKKWVKSLNINWCHYPRSAQIIDRDCQWFGLPWLTPEKYQIGGRLKPTLYDYLQLSKDSLKGLFFNNRLDEDYPTETYFNHSYSKEFAGKFLKPFFRGVFLDRYLMAPIPLFQYYLNLFLRGGVAIPENGMGEITRKLALGLHKNSLFLHKKVQKVILNQNRWVLKIHDCEELHADVVVIATDDHQACKLFPELGNPSTPLPLSTHFFLTNNIPEKLGPLNLFPNGKSIHGIAIPTIVAPKYTNGNFHLLMITTLGSKHIHKEDILKELIQLSILENEKWEWIHHIPLGQTLPKARKVIFENPNLILSGDWTCLPSIEGACQSGENAAKKASYYIQKQSR